MGHATHPLPPYDQRDQAATLKARWGRKHFTQCLVVYGIFEYLSPLRSLSRTLLGTIVYLPSFTIRIQLYVGKYTIHGAFGLWMLWFTAVLVLGYWWWAYQGRKGNFCFFHSGYIVSISPHHTRYPGYLRTPGILGIVAGITGIWVKLPTCKVSPVSPIIPYTSISSESLAIPGSASIFASSVFKVLRITMNCESKSNGLIHQ